MRELLKTAKKALEAGENLMLVTVVAASGSTPRGAGSRMLVGRNGRLYGTIGGGAIEFRAEQMSQEYLANGKSELTHFELTKEDKQNLGMVCGGNVTLFFRYLSALDESLQTLCEEAEELFQKGESIWLISEPEQGGEIGLISSAQSASAVPFPENIRSFLGSKDGIYSVDGKQYYIEQINSAGRVFIFGGGHVGQALAKVLQFLKYRYVVMDDREEFTRAELFPDAEAVRLINFDDSAVYTEIGAEDALCIMTRGHAFDTVVQAHAISTPAGYIGVIGSARKRDAVFAQLRENWGISDAELTRITTPIGLCIGAETPEEIAISIAGQLIEYRSRGRK